MTGTVLIPCQGGKERKSVWELEVVQPPWPEASSVSTLADRPEAFNSLPSVTFFPAVGVKAEHHPIRAYWVS